jgi:hypothetical protein
VVEGENLGSSTPINQQEAISADEVEKSIRERVERLSGDELVQSLVDYIMLTVMEVEFLKDPAPRPLWALNSHKVEVTQELTRAITSPSDRDNI